MGAAGVVEDEAARAMAQGEPGELEAGRPALRARLQRPQLLRVHVAPEPGQHAGGVGVREAQVRGPDLRELSPRPQPGQAERRVAARRHGDVQRRRGTLDERAEGAQGLGVLDGVEVVEHEDDRRRTGHELVDDERHDGAGEARARRAQGSAGLGSEAGVDTVEGTQHAVPEADGVRVVGIEAQPGEATRLAGPGRPLGDERRLARPCGRAHEGQAGVARGGQAAQQRLARDQAAAQAGDLELRRGEDLALHGATLSGTPPAVGRHSRRRGARRQASPRR